MVFLAIIAIVLPTSSGDQAGNITKTIAVTGVGEVKAQPDIARLTISVVTESEKADVAATENSARMNSVISALKRVGISEEDMKTTGYSLYPKYIYPRDGEQRIVGYIARNSLVVTVENMDILGKVIDEAVANGANNIDNIQFTFSDEKYAELYDLALKKAVENAQNKAQVIAKTMGIKNYYPMTITLQEAYYPVPVPMVKEAYAGSVTTTPIQVGKESLSVRVNVIYAFP